MLLPVPTSPAASPYAASTASALVKYLPPYTYNLTEESNETKTAICTQQIQFCATSRCTSNSANVTVNFCNPNTMGWNCECNNKATSRLAPIVAPVTTYAECRLRALSCLDACQNPKNTAVTNVQTCQTACNYILTSVCGTSAEVVPFYQVKNYDDKPKYYPDTSKGGVSLGVNTSAGLRSHGLVSPLLFVGATMLGTLFVVL
ncbi:BQ2448_6345 [Microbotryum intermedium]|uniref:BQ2448_6345 protein n=1 Tax=Microbotryum intermedium TaxID=269621 RepID=A0A238FL71_9BASI|nr:BQ2448_6345 [Microbotryum intermedium]